MRVVYPGRRARVEGLQQSQKAARGRSRASVGSGAHLWVRMLLNPHRAPPPLRPAGSQLGSASLAALHATAATGAARRRQESFTAVHSPPHRGSGHGGGDSPPPSLRLRVGHARLDGDGKFPPPSVLSPTVPPNLRHRATLTKPAMSPSRRRTSRSRCARCQPKQRARSLR